MKRGVKSRKIWEKQSSPANNQNEFMLYLSVLKKCGLDKSSPYNKKVCLINKAPTIKRCV